MSKKWTEYCKRKIILSYYGQMDCMCKFILGSIKLPQPILTTDLYGGLRMSYSRNKFSLEDCWYKHQRSMRY